MSTRIVELADELNSKTRLFSDYLLANGLPTPSFKEDGPVKYRIESPEIQQARKESINACQELLDLLKGPQGLIVPVFNATSAQAIFRYNLPQKVPIGGSISFKDLADVCDLYEPDLRRIVRFAITYHRIFREDKDGHVSHSAASRYLAEDSDAFHGFGFIYDIQDHAFARTMDSIQQWHSQEPDKTGFNLAYSTSENFFEYLATHPAEQAMYAKTMKAVAADIPGRSISYLVSSYPWSSVPAGATVIDMGGSTGATAIALARAFGHLKFVVRDTPSVIEQAGELPDDLAGRVRLEGHSFFEPPPPKEETEHADVYLFRQVFHDWPDAYVTKILKTLTPALRKGDRVLVNDAVCPAPNTVPHDAERAIRCIDMAMLSIHNSREREMHDWEPLFKAADKRFGKLKFYFPPGAGLAVMESVWEA